MNNCLDALAETLNGLLPVCPTGQVCREVVDTGAGCVRLAHMPIGAPMVLSACGATIDADQYLMDYTSGMLYTCVRDGQVLVAYRYNLAATYIEQAVRDVGVRLPQRNTICTPLFANCGLAPLPCEVQWIDWIRVSDCTCGQPSCHQCLTLPRCQRNDFSFTCGRCGLYQRGDVLVVDPPPCEDRMLHLCYLGGYPLDKQGCFVGLTPALADLVLLKAQALAYSNPRLLFDLTGVTSASNSTTGTGSEENAYSETITVTKTYGTCGKETGSVTTKSGTKNTDSSSSSSLLSSSSALTQWLSLARQFQADYEKALLLRMESANVGRAARRRGYRAQLAARDKMTR